MPQGISRNLIEIIIASQNQADDGLDAAAKSVKQLGKEILIAGAAMQGAGAAIVGGMIAITMQTARAADTFAKFERATGIAASTLAGLNFAVQRWGGQVRDVDTALRRLTNAVADASSGLETYTRAFRRIGISTEELIGADGSLIAIDKLLPILADKFAGMTDAVTKAAVAQELLGRGGLRLIPLLNQGAEGIEKLAQRADRLGIVLSDSAIAQAELFQDALLDMKESIKGVQFALGEQLMPSFTQTMVAATEMIVQLKDWVRLNPVLASGIIKLGTALFAAGGIITGVGLLIKLLPVVRGLMLTTFAASGPVAIGLIAFAILVGAITGKMLNLRQSIEDVLETGDKRIFEESLRRTQERAKELLAEIIAIEEEIAEIEKGVENRGEVKPLDQAKIGRANDKLVIFKTLLGEAVVEADRLNSAIANRDANKALAAMTLHVRGLSDAMFKLQVLTGQRTMKEQFERNSAQVNKTTEDIKKLDKQLEKVGLSEETILSILTEINALEQNLLRLEQERLGLVDEMREKRQALLDESMEGFKQLGGPDDPVLMALQKWQDAVRELGTTIQGPLSSAFNSFFQTITTHGASMADAFKASFRSMTASVLAMLAQMLAGVIALRIAMAFIPGGNIVGAPIVLNAFSSLAAHGGVITAGTRGVDNVPILAQRGEAILDTETTDSLKEQLSDGGGTGGGMHITINTGVATFSQQEAIRFGREVLEETGKVSGFTGQGRV